jgi:multiple sugar transport system substrate-binding protein
MRKRFISVLVIALMLTGFAFAGGEGETASGTGEVTLQVWLRGSTQYLEAYNEMGKMFTAQYPNIKVEFTLVSDMEDKLVTAMIGGEGPDAWIMDTVTTGRWIKFGMAKEIDTKMYPNYDKIIPAAWDTLYGSDGKIYGTPWSVQAQAMYYRQDWLDALGMDVPTTWDEMVEVGLAMTYEDPDGNGKDDTYGVGVYGATLRGYAYWTFQDWLWQAGGSVLKEMSPGKWQAALSTPEAIKALQFEHDLAYKYKICQPGFQTAVSADIYGAMQDGLVGMVFHAGYRILEYKDRHGDGLGTAMMPAGPAGGWTLGEGENLYMSSQTENVEAVMTWMNWMTSVEAQSFGLKNDISNVCRTSVRTDVDNMKVTGEPLMKAFVDAFQNVVKYPESIPDYYPVKLLVAEMVQMVLSDPNADIKSIAADYNQQVNDVLASQGIYEE